MRGEHADAAAIWSFGERIDDELLDALPNLRAVGNEGVGFDTVDVAALDRRGIALCIPRGQNAAAVADHAIALLLALRHQVVAGDRYIREGHWGRRGAEEPQGLDIAGTTLGIVGLGNIGQAVARRAEVFGLRVVGWNRTPRPETGIEQLPLDDLLERSDHVTLHCALADTTRGLLGAREIALLRPTAVLINTARGCDRRQRGAGRRAAGGSPVGCGPRRVPGGAEGRPAPARAPARGRDPAHRRQPARRVRLAHGGRRGRARSGVRTALSATARATLEPMAVFEYAPAPESVRPALKPRYDLFIDGAWRRSKGGKRAATINPATEEPLTEVVEPNAPTSMPPSPRPPTPSAAGRT